MSAGRATYLPLTEKRFPSEHSSLLAAYQSRSSWIWTNETSPYTAPNAPAGEQRGFRFTYTNYDLTRTPSNATIVLTVDNYFALYINGAIVHEADFRNNFFTSSAFSVPLQSPSNKTVFAVRAINDKTTADQMQNPAGLIAAVKINFQGSEGSEVFVSGTDMKWVGESLLAPGWEETNFDDGSWEPAIVYPPTVADLTWPDQRRAPSTLAVATRLTSPQTTVSIPPGCSNHDSSGKLQPGAWAGIVVGAALLAAVATFFLTRRRYQPMRASLASSSQIAHTSVPPTIQTTPLTHPPNHAHQESLGIFNPASVPTEHHDDPPAYAGTRDGAASVVSSSAGSSNQQPPGPRYASVHKSRISTGGLPNR